MLGGLQFIVSASRSFILQLQLLFQLFYFIGETCCDFSEVLLSMFSRTVLCRVEGSYF